MAEQSKDMKKVYEEQKHQQSRMQQKKQVYQEYVEQMTPKKNIWWQMIKAFIVGGLICTLGQLILNVATDQFGLDKETARTWCSVILVLLSVLLTGFNLYQKLGAFAGAGALVPITGFANSVASPAIEYQKEARYSVSALRSLRSRTGHPLRDRYKLGARLRVLDREMFRGVVKPKITNFHAGLCFVRNCFGVQSRYFLKHLIIWLQSEKPVSWLM